MQESSLQRKPAYQTPENFAQFKLDEPKVFENPHPEPELSGIPAEERKSELPG